MTDPQPNDGFVWTQEPWGRALRCVRLSVPHLFTSRDLTLRGPSAASGLSRVTAGGTDDREWEMVAESIGVAADRLLLVKQVHGIDAAVARRNTTAAWPRPNADIIVSDDRSVAIGVRVADCAPILLHDHVKNVVGAAHAGWRGAAAGAAAAAVEVMHREFGTDARDLVAAIGPCLGKCCGEVGPDVVDAFRAGGADDAAMAAWFTPGDGDRSFLDLERANRDQLIAAGVNPDFIFASGLCTKTHHDRLHSYRAGREHAGRMLGAIRIGD